MSNINALWEAIDEGDDQVVRRLLSEYPELVEATDKYGSTPLMHAVGYFERTVPVIKAILASGADVNRRTKEGYTALHCAVDVDGEANENTEEVIGLLV